MTTVAVGERYVIPLSHVHESTRPDPADVHFVSGMGEVYSLRGENLPVYRLTELLGKKPATAPAATTSIAIVVRTLGQPFAVLVDDIIGQHQVVIKQLGAEHRGLKGFSGSAIMGDGRAALILELAELVSRHKSNATQPQSTQRRSAA
jgi:two-component system chemotaxis sensor kinase CheA